MKLRKILYIMSTIVMFTPHITLAVSESHFPEKDDTSFGVSATRQDIVIGHDLQIPPAAKDEKIPTLNQTGFMTPDQSPYSTAFIEFAARCKLPTLDIGAAYGLITIPALERGARVIANDSDARHLLLLRKQTKQKLWSSLLLNNKKFPHETTFLDNSLGAIILCRVAHFLTESDMEEGIKKIKSWLVPGGRIFIVTMSPHHHLLTEFLPEYKAKIQQQIAWPGVITDMHKRAPHLQSQIPNFLHVMDEHSLGKALQKHNLIIIEQGLFDYLRPGAKSSDGKGYYGVIAEKPTENKENDHGTD